MDNCVFCNVVHDDVRGQVIDRSAQEKGFIAIKKPYFSKDVNFLVITTEHVDNLHTASGGNKVDMNSLFDYVRFLANGKDFSCKVSNGKNAGQDVFHLHVHVNSYEPWNSWEVLRKCGQKGLKERPQQRRTQTNWKK